MRLFLETEDASLSQMSVSVELLVWRAKSQIVRTKVLNTFAHNPRSKFSASETNFRSVSHIFLFIKIVCIYYSLVSIPIFNVQSSFAQHFQLDPLPSKYMYTSFMQ